jgi:hypothetical protein
MLEIQKTAIALDEIDLIELERIIIDGNKDDALKFIKESIYEKVVRSQQGKLKSHLNGDNNSAESFKNRS